MVDISIHALRKESDKPFAKKFRWNAISIHALRKESDEQIWRDHDGRAEISIHALRKESD